MEGRRRVSRRTPLIVALAVFGLSAGVVVVAQANVTDQASVAAVKPADVAAAPVAVVGAALPAAANSTSTAPKVETPPPVTTPPALDIQALDQSVIADAQEARDAAAKDGKPVDDDNKANPDDLVEVKKIKVKKATNYDPDQRVGVEFGKPRAAIDKRSRTVWDVNVPADGQSFNVGIVLDLGETVKTSAIVIGTPTPGFGAEIYRADSDEIPPTLQDKDWTKAAEVPDVSDDLTVPIASTPKWTRYILVYLTTPRSADDTRAALSNLEVLP